MNEENQKKFEYLEERIMELEEDIDELTFIVKAMSDYILKDKFCEKCKNEDIGCVCLD